jgi:peptide deformylase
VIQHETDHLDGVLFLDRMPTFATLTFLTSMRGQAEEPTIVI